MSTHYLAQLNIALMRAPLESPAMADFVANLDRINALAERSPGFVWRLKDDAGNATAIRPFGEDRLVNLSVWKDVESLRDFVYRSSHAEILKRRREWFERMTQSYLVLWWIPAERLPTVEEAAKRLAHLSAHGETAHAFTFKQIFPAPATRSALKA